MSSIVDEVTKLVDPTPQFFDPEDDINIETAARVVERFDEGSTTQSEVSNLRRKTALLLEDFDTRYTGRRISRKSFDQTHDSENESSSGNEESEDDNEIEEDLKYFKQSFENTDLQDSQELDDASSSEGSHDNGSEVESDSDSGERSDTSIESDEEKEQETEEDMFKKFSHIDVNEEIEKGKAVEAQLGLWNKFCECRIQFQKILTSANRLPQFDTWSDFKNRGDKDYSSALEKGCVAIKSLLDNMLEVQSQLLLSNPETKNFLAVNNCPSAQESEEEISSGSESGNEKAIMRSKKCSPKKETKKRKLKLDEYGDILAKRFKTFIPYRNSAVQKWDDKTRLTTGKMTQKSFSAFNVPALKQIDQILQDKRRLIQRTQLKRSVYKVLGKDEENANDPNLSEESNKVVEGHVKRDEHLNCYDPEIFDDDDFYRLLLKDIIEAKTVGMDPAVLRTHLELQKNRRKMKKQVDTKASKGRKLRYDPHPKMVNFMVSINTLYPEGTRVDLFKRIFSQSSAINVS